jgi:signal transduction histidine kinase
VTALAVYTFAALLFSALVLFYAGERLRGAAARSAVLPVFTLVCAVAFVASVLSRFVFLHEIATGLMPPLILHLVLEDEWQSPPRRRVWRAALVFCYAASTIFALLRAAAPFPTDFLSRTPAAMLAFAAASGLLASHRRSTRALLALMALCAAAGLAGWSIVIGSAPDYLILAFFAVTLYYRERLAFFDVLVKRGAFLALGMAAVALCVSLAIEQWIAVALLGFWLAGAWLYPRLARAIDRRWLRRPYSPADAEREFLRAVQGAASEQDLADRAAASLAGIFQAPARVRFDADAGAIELDPRPDGIPFLSDDRRLLATLSGALDLVRENVRFRAREQQLRLLATQAQLKALRAQINPHFLFNSLSVIAGLIQYDPQLADETIEQLAQIFRYTLSKSENEWASLADEIEFAAAYLRIEQARFGDRLRTDLSVDPAAAALPVPAMCVQPLIENAVKHGVAQTPGPGAVSLRATLAGDELRIEVSDSGPGFPPGFRLDGAAEGHGLRNVADRLRGYYGSAARIYCENGPAGARVTLAMPCAAVRAGSVPA